ncbi:hypothetical protein [Paucisalibacillus sp. EB02]|uniref:hypothetical protein n=1 Tax=Paucisalibacillus sp. EB02 TaxID=1347087 RepID=UPI0004AF541B|nr:hypothetical protein [Paucisalibacillus sp. EB02]
MNNSSNNTVYEYRNKNNIYIWTITTIIVIAMVAGGIFYFVAPFYFFDNTHETFFMAFYITLAPLVIFLVFMMVNYYVSMLKTNNKLNNYKISKEGFFYKHHISDDQYMEGYIDFSKIKRCVISRKIVEVRKPHYKERFLVYPVIHLIYEDHQKINHFMLQHEHYTKDAMNYLLSSLSNIHILIEYTERQLYLVPEEKLLEILDSNVKTRSFPINGSIFEYEEFSGFTSEKPKPEMGPLYKENLERQGIHYFCYPVWLLFAVQFVVYLVIFSFAANEKMNEKSLILTNVIPYIFILISYILYVYRLERAKYWKSMLHWLYSQVTMVLAFLLVDNIFDNLDAEVVLQEISSINIGFHLASFIPHFITVLMVRSEWPAIYHEETKLAMNHQA